MSQIRMFFSELPILHHISSAPRVALLIAPLIVLCILPSCTTSSSALPTPTVPEPLSTSTMTSDLPAIAVTPAMAPVVTSAPEAAPSDAKVSMTEVVTGIVNSTQATLYAKPNKQADVLGMVAEGMQVNIVAEEIIDGDEANRWFLICCPIEPELLSWIPEEALTLEESVQHSVLRVADLLTQPIAASSQASITESAVLSKTATTLQVDDSRDTGQSDPSREPTVAVTVDLVNLRGGPGTNYAVVGQASAATEMDVIGRNDAGTWWRVCCPVGDPGEKETEIWVFGELVAPVGDRSDATLTSVALADVPLVEIPPTPEVVTVTEAGVGGGGGNQSVDNSAALAAAPAPGLPGNGGFGAPGGTNPLTGLGLPGSRAGQRPIIVCINNDFAARPQFGTSQADVMYEYLMEGFGITRFSGVYYGEDVAQIGPVRSARLINYYMAALYNAGLACSGASDGVRYTLKHESPFPYMDIDLDDPSNTRYSVSIGTDYRTRLRTATASLRRWLADWGVEQPATVRGFSFGGLPGGGLPATGVTIPYPGGSRSAYQYDGGSGRYLRFLGDAPHVDGNSGTQIGVENVVIQFVPHQATDIVEDSLGSTSIRLNLFGEGKAFLFRDGFAFEGSWRSDSRGDLPHFYNGDGSEIPLKPGKTWISVVPLSYTIGIQ